MKHSPEYPIGWQRIRTGSTSDDWGFRLLKADGNAAAECDLRNVSQETDLWTGIVTSRFSLEGHPVEVRTACHPDRDAVGVEVASPLLKQGRLQLFLDFPYADDRYITEYVGDYDRPERHVSRLTAQNDTTALIQRTMDSVTYNVALHWNDPSARLDAPQTGAHRFLYAPATAADSP